MTQLFYNPSLDNSFKQFFFPEDESKHIVRVLRKDVGDILHLTNGRGYFYEAKILTADPKKCKAQIVDEDKVIPTLHQLHMAVAVTKSMDRFEWFLEKATEIGVHKITPIIAKRSERKTIKLERLQKIVQASMKQSLQAYLPELGPLTPFEGILKDSESRLKFIAHCEKGEKRELKRALAADKDTLILIGPEGDFTHEEIKAARDAGFTPISLGKNRLRTETAAVVAVATVALINS